MFGLSYMQHFSLKKMEWTTTEMIRQLHMIWAVAGSVDAPFFLCSIYFKGTKIYLEDFIFCNYKGDSL